jgi:DNA (cytosine-5)-methyltransferase 1
MNAPDHDHDQRRDSSLVAGSLCSGILGLDLATESHFGCEFAWCAEIEPAPSLVIEKHRPFMPNLGDITNLQWDLVPPVDVLTAGYPCQPFSSAGRRKGAKDARHLWPHIAEAIRVLRPQHIILENVRGHLSLGFDRVLWDLAEAGFDAEWCLLRASDVGAPHQRARVFIVATDTLRSGAGRDTREVQAAASRARRQEVDLRPAGHGDADAPDAEGERCGPVQGHEVAERTTVEPRRRSDALPTDTAGGRRCGQPTGADDQRKATERSEAFGEPDDGAPSRDWGRFEPAIRRWEHELGRLAPRPLDDRNRLSPRFVEWMMGYDDGWVTDLYLPDADPRPDLISRTQALRMLGNGVVPQQARAALSVLAPVRAIAA